MKYSKMDEIRFWSKVVVSSQSGGCWLWSESKHTFGYGWFRINNKTYLAHRLALIFYNDGVEEVNLQALHSCDNPPCCNPLHLRWGTAKDNIDDEIKRNRKTDPPVFYGENHPGSKLKNKDVFEIRTLLLSGLTSVEIAKKYNVCANTICGIKNGEHWRSI